MLQLAVEIAVSNAAKAHEALRDNRAMFSNLSQEASNFYLIGNDDMDEEEIEEIKDWVGETLTSQNIDFWYTEY